MKLEVKNLNFGYDETKKILEDISFCLEGNGIFCILGQNGTGKSTLLKCITGEEKAEGKVLIDNNEFSSYSVRQMARKIAYLPQNHVPTFPFPVIEVVMMGRSAHMKYFDSPDKEEREIAMENLEFLGIAHLKDKPYTNISGGERQLVMIAAALTQQPEFLILDEPTSHLDFGKSHKFLDLVHRLNRNDMGILMTTHFPDHALYLGAETLILKNSRLWKKGPAKEVITEETMTDLYELPVHIDTIGDRNICLAGNIRMGGET